MTNIDKTTALDGQSQRLLAGRYVLQGLLGQGGMADVELAYDQILDRQVAAKMLHTRYAGDPSFLERFRREAQAAASLNHPNVVAVYDTGQGDGRPFIVMEYVKGRSLRDVLRTEEILPQRAAEIVGEAASALHYAHERGLVHRDVKPANIMINDEGRVKVADFGIARAVNAETITQTSTVFGTAAYVSPEQAQGEPVDRRSDIYSLGVVLYEMLAHRPPFEGDSAVSLAYKHVVEQPPPPSQHNPEVWPELDAITAKAMAKNPADRYSTARELNDDLRRALAGMRVSAPAATAYAPTTAISNRDRTLQTTPYGRGPAADEADDRPPRRVTPGMILFILTLLALFVIAGYFIADLSREDPGTLTRVPDVARLNLDDARLQLEKDGFEVRTGEAEPSNQPDNTVVRTDPEAGQEVATGSRVYIIPSGGPIIVPDVSGEPPEKAREILGASGLKVAPGQQLAASDEVEEGLVIGTDPEVNRPVGPDDPVTLIVSEGPSGLQMPDVIGLSVDDASSRILRECPERQPACVEIREQPVSGGEEGKVAETEPRKGGTVPFGSRVVLQVSDGEDEETEEPTEEPSSNEDDNGDETETLGGGLLGPRRG